MKQSQVMTCTELTITETINFTKTTGSAGPIAEMALTHGDHRMPIADRGSTGRTVFHIGSFVWGDNG